MWGRNKAKYNSKIFILSGDTEIHNINRCYNFGIIKFIKKPNELYNVFNIIENSII